MATQGKRNWTVFFIIKSVGASIYEVIKMINEIRSLEMKPDVSIILCLNFARERLDSVLKGDVTPKDIEDTTSTTIFFSVVPETDANPPFPSRLEIIGENPDFDITDPNCLKGYFRTEILAGHEADRYMLVTWDHGNAYGIFEETITTDGEFNPDVKIRKENAKVLTMEELNTAIYYAFNGKKVDLLLMMNCYVQFIDAGYALRQSVKCLVGPESSIDIRGYNYVFIFSVLLNKPGISTKKLAKLVVRTFVTKLYPDRNDGVYIQKHTALFATDIRYFSLLATQIDKMVNALLPLSTQSKNILVKIKDKNMCIPGKDLVDFYSFIKAIEGAEILPGDLQSLNVVLPLQELLFFEKHVGGSLGEPFTGILIYFPSSVPLPGTEEHDSNEFLHTEFIQKTKWIDLVRACG